MENFKQRSKLSLLYAVATLLPIFLLGVLSPFNPLSFICLGVFWFQALLHKSDSLSQKDQGSLYSTLRLQLLLTTLMILSPAYFYATFFVANARIFFDYKDSRFIKHQLQAMFSGPRKTSHILWLETIYLLSVDSVIALLVHQFLPVTMAKFSTNYLPLGIFFGQLSFRASKQIKSACAEYSRFMESDSLKNMSISTDRNESRSPALT